MLSRVIINAVFGLFVFLVGATVVNAAAIGVSPVRVTLSDKQKIGTITLRNDGTDPVPMQLEALKWSKEEGEDVFTSTRELIVIHLFSPFRLVAHSYFELDCGVLLMRSASWPTVSFYRNCHRHQALILTGQKCLCVSAFQCLYCPKLQLIHCCAGKQSVLQMDHSK
jgi:hypothetical protein